MSKTKIVLAITPNAKLLNLICNLKSNYVRKRPSIHCYKACNVFLQEYYESKAYPHVFVVRVLLIMDNLVFAGLTIA